MSEDDRGTTPPWHDPWGADEPTASTTMSRLRDRAGRWLALLLSVLLVLPLGAWAIDTLVFQARGAVVAQAVPELADAVALVQRVGCDGSAGTGSGFATVLDGRPVVLTNRHVVERASSVGLRTLDGTAGPAVTEVLLGRSEDVAVLVLDRPLPSRLGLGADGAPGDEVRLVGFPGARPVTTSGSVVERARTRVLLDIEVGGGASGAPVVDEDGAVVAQVVARRSDGSGVAIAASEVARAAQGAVPAPGC